MRRGEKPPSEYVAWQNMIRRCTWPKHKHFAHYGGRGITVCENWRTSYAAFLSDVGVKPSAAHQLERIDNNGNYEPGNVRWATVKEQKRNTRRNVNITALGKTQCLKDWAAEYGLGQSTIRGRLKAGWAPEDAVSTPATTRTRNEKGQYT